MVKGFILLYPGFQNSNLYLTGVDFINTTSNSTSVEAKNGYNLA